ncbi:C-terminal binding protein [Oceanobacillus sp. Castelsardo]|uniref:C-terminal binding protein n=1 Tax=Oceanobacillus sp. Castelsardo TaxID=1851204 RepID=UPI000837EECA|nr:C-terminal binding protein [Oceanobacillus sp. Castelsardo]
MSNKRPLVWILDDEWENHEVEMQRYDDAGYDVKITRIQELEKDLPVYGPIANGVVAQIGFPCGKKVIDVLDNCRVIAISGVGFNHVDIEAAADKGIYVSNVPDYCMDEVSDHTVALLLHWMRRLTPFHKDVRENRKWDPLNITNIRRTRNVTVGLLGFGRIARKVAEKLQAFGCRIIAHDKYVDVETFRKLNVECVSFDTLLEESEFLSLHVPLTPETKHIINEESFKKLPKGAYIVNTCRGGIINENDLVQAIRLGYISGAGLDVLEQEPPNFDNPLIHMDEVLITPHSSYNSVESILELRNRTCDLIIEGVETGELQQSLNGKEIENKITR